MAQSLSYPPYLAAREVIQDHLVDDDGMLEIPIDPFALAAQLGIEVALSALEENTAGLIVRDAESDQTRVFLNRTDARNRQKFTLAHELGHYFRHEHDGDHVFGYVDERADLASRGHDPKEIWANKFAAELLMPAVAVRKFFGDGYSVPRLAREFGVSEQAMGFRLVNLGLT